MEENEVMRQDIRFPGEEEEEMTECRICRSGSEPGRPLYHPCRCSGTIRYTHEDCLVGWLSQSGSRQCELCQHPFRFEPLYSPNTPTKLSLLELLGGLITRARRTLEEMARPALVIIVWMFLLPIGTCWTWHALFLKSPAEVVSFFANRGLAGIPTDAFNGSLISGGIVLVFLGVTSLRAYLRIVDDVAVEEQMLQNIEPHGHEDVPEAANNRIGDADEHDREPAPGDDTNHNRALEQVHNLPPVDDLPVQEQANVINEDDNGVFLGWIDFDADEVPPEEVFGLRGPIRNLFDNAGTALVSNAIFLGVFTLVPLLTGRLALRIASLPMVKDQIFNRLSANDLFGLPEKAADISHFELSNFYTVALGYAVIGLTATTCVLASSLLQGRLPRLYNPLTRQLIQFVYHTATFFKVVMLTVWEFIIYPIGLGWWIDACTVRFIDSSFASSRNFFLRSPRLSMMMHWSIGLMYICKIIFFVQVLRDVLRPELLWFLRNPDDPDLNPFREFVEEPLSRHARRMCLSFLIYAPLIVLLIFVPLEVCMAALPHTFPLRLQFENLVPEVSAEVAVFYFYVFPLAGTMQFSQPRVIMQKCFIMWIKFVGSAVGLTEFVLKDEHQNRENNGQTSEERELPSYYRARGAVMLFFAWLSMMMLTCLVVTIPTVLGRYIFSALSLELNHDVYTFGLGMLIMWGSINGVLRLYHFAHNYNLRLAAVHFVRWLFDGGLRAVFFCFHFAILPFLIGMYIEMTFMIPIRRSNLESVSSVMYRWGLGLSPQRIIGWRWYDKIERMPGDGAGRRFLTALKTLIYPWVQFWIIMLVAPYLLAYLFIYTANLQGVATEFVLGWVHFLSACLYACIHLVDNMRRLAVRLHDSIRDDIYLEGRRLHNYARGPTAENNPAALTTNVQPTTDDASTHHLQVTAVDNNT